MTDRQIDFPMPPPPVLRGTEQEQIRQLWSYTKELREMLMRAFDQINERK